MPLWALNPWTWIHVPPKRRQALAHQRVVAQLRTSRLLHGTPVSARIAESPAAWHSDDRFITRNERARGGAGCEDETWSDCGGERGGGAGPTGVRLQLRKIPEILKLAAKRQRQSRLLSMWNVFITVFKTARHWATTWQTTFPLRKLRGPPYAPICDFLGFRRGAREAATPPPHTHTQNYTESHTTMKQLLQFHKPLTPHVRRACCMSHRWA
jgi:hypothetical protein